MKQNKDREMYLANIIELRDYLRNGWKPYEWFPQHLQTTVNHCEGLRPFARSKKNL